MPHNFNGQKWIRNEKRCAIYARDGFACAYCDARPRSLKIDHVIPDAGNDESNLVTCCQQCNNRKGERTLHAWLESRASAGESIEKLDAIRQFVAMLTFLPIDMTTGKWLEAQRGRGRGSFSRLRDKWEREFNKQRAASAA